MGGGAVKRRAAPTASRALLLPLTAVGVDAAAGAPPRLQHDDVVPCQQQLPRGPQARHTRADDDDALAERWTRELHGGTIMMTMMDTS